MNQPIEVWERHEILIEFHPHAYSLNQKIIDQSTKLYFAKHAVQAGGNDSNVKALQTKAIDPDLDNMSSLKLVNRWILQLMGKCGGFHYEVFAAWLAKYQKGDYTISHDHLPAAFSFVYFVKCPKGSSPLIFTSSGKRIKAEEGKLVLFPGGVRHHVPKNKCDDRITYAGNIWPIED